MQRKHKGFTLLEILLVIAAIGILAAIVLVAINPNRQIALAQNSRRSNDVGSIYKALQQYNIDNERYPAAIEGMDTGFADRVDICQFGQVSINCLDVSSDLTPTYLADIPEDPSGATSTSTRYSIIKNLNNTIAVRSEEAQLGKEIIAGVILDGGGTLNAPSAIGDLSAQVIGGNSVQLTWSAPVSPLPISEYIVIYSSGQNFSSETIINGVTNTTYLVENLNIGIYEFKVIAVNAEAQGPDSNIVQGVLCGGGTCIDYGGNDWIISSNQTVSGLHYNIDTFRVNSGITASTALGTNFAVYADQYEGLGTINASGLGYRGGRDGHGGDNGLGPGGGGIDSGGGHGGTGGGPAGGVQYGSISQPLDLGSGGGHQPGYGVTGGRGGGAIKIVTSGDIDVSGNILANGVAGTGTYYSGGAGGSIWLQAGGQMSGAGTITVIGGPAFGAFGGAGGRIALYYGSNTFSGTISANGGAGTSGIGGAGTIWQGNLTSGARLLTISNGDLGTVNNPITRIDNGSFTETTLQNFTIAGRANVVLDKSLTIGNTNFSIASNSRFTQNAVIVGPSMASFSLGSGAIWQQNAEMGGVSLTSMNIAGTWIRDITQVFNQGNAVVTVVSGGLITHNIHPVSGTKERGLDMVLGGLVVQSGGNIDVSGRGYRGGRDGHGGDNGLGPGGGGIDSGGGHGATGGGPAGGVQYGSVSQPVELGSGGGHQPGYGVTGGRGGGAIKITTSGDIEVAGSILANGSAGVGTYYSGGAGGSIWLQAGGQMRGAGTVSAIGGPAFGAFGGAGGRMAIYYGSNTFSGTIAANGGNGTSGIGGAGTIWQGNLSGSRLLTISNGDLGTVNNPVTRIDNGSFTETALQNFTVAGRANVVLDKSIDIGNNSLNLASNSRLTQNVQLNAGTSGTINIGGIWVISGLVVGGNVTVQSGGLVTHNLNPAVGTKQVGIDMNLTSFTIQNGGNMDVTGLGYRGGQDGHGGDNGLGPGGGIASGAGGGGYGGSGGAAGGGVQYGSVSEPIELGSGGAREMSYGATGGRGGGAIKIVTSGDIEIAGNMRSNGATGTGWYYTAGSGGSIWLQAGGQMRGAGIIQSNGGDSFAGGSGAGGRIALYYGSNTFSGTITANAGNGTGGTIGGAGTIWQGNLASGARLLTISNGDLGTVNNPITRIDSGSFTETTLQNFTIAGRANVVLDKGLTIGNTNFSIASNSRFTQNATIVGPSMLSFSLGSGAVWQQNAEMTGGLLIGMNISGTWIRDITQVFNQGIAVLTVGNGGLITHSIHPVSGTKQRGLDMVLGGLVVQSGGNINVAGLGFRGGQDGHGGDNGLGPGGGVNAGGGHGGAGGGPGGGVQYGSLMNPVDLGSGGGRDNFYVSTGGRGGGAIKIVVSGDIEVAGNILANGAGGTGTYYTGGAGGSIWLQAGGQLRGSGVIQSNGGGAFGAPGGGGGRIALYYGSNIFSGTVTANGANGGGAGTVYQ